MATLKDVAKFANVDISTVSRALNNKGYVHEETKKRIMEFFYCVHMKKGNLE